MHREEMAGLCFAHIILPFRPPPPLRCAVRGRSLRPRRGSCAVEVSACLGLKQVSGAFSCFLCALIYAGMEGKLSPTQHLVS